MNLLICAQILIFHVYDYSNTGLFLLFCRDAFAGGWFHTGDLAVHHGNGRIEIKDRSKDIIISGGENISSIEVESILLTHPMIDEVSVIAMPDDKWGEIPVAVVVLRLDLTTTMIGPEELIKWARERMAGYQTPKVIRYVDTLPKTSTGKIQKNVLRDLMRDKGL
jgi:fatty-acyl-CoA synthase